MDDVFLRHAEAILEGAFPLARFNCMEIRCLDARDVQRVADELSVAGLCDQTWHNVTSGVARGTWDVLALMEPCSMSILLPGYLRWLYDLDEADVLVHGLPMTLLRILEAPLHSIGSTQFTPDQLVALQVFFASVIQETAMHLQPEEVETYRKAISMLQRVELLTLPDRNTRGAGTF